MVFLFSGQMIERKGVDVVLAAFERIAQRNEKVALLLLGDGPRKTEYENGIPEHLRPRVHFTGRLSQNELPAHFAAADVFVFPSRHDGWGVVVNEACGAGLPVIASRQTGAALDLVGEGGNGFLLDCEDIEGFAAKMEFFVERPETVREFGRCSRELAQKFSTGAGARRFQDCVLETIGGPRAEPTDP
jgi:glycosyltransferase involved in cell wall biosynthesis